MYCLIPSAGCGSWVSTVFPEPMPLNKPKESLPSVRLFHLSTANPLRLNLDMASSLRPNDGALVAIRFRPLILPRD